MQQDQLNIDAEDIPKHQDHISLKAQHTHVKNYDIYLRSQPKQQRKRDRPSMRKYCSNTQVARTNLRGYIAYNKLGLYELVEARSTYVI